MTPLYVSYSFIQNMFIFIESNKNEHEMNKKQQKRTLNEQKRKNNHRPFLGSPEAAETKSRRGPPF